MMEEDNKIKQEQKFLFVVVAILFSGILILNCYTPLIADDYVFHYVYGENERIDSVFNLFESTKNYYLFWTGRILAHFLAQLFQMPDKIIFNILNSIAYTALILIMAKNISGKKKISALLVMFLSITMFLGVPVFGQNVLWIVGSANYLWTALFIFSFLLIYRLQINVPIVVMIFYGILAGNTNENTGGALIVTLILLLIWKKYKHVKILKWEIAGIISVIVGFLSMLLAPGNYVRNENLSSVSAESLFTKLLDRFNDIVYVLRYHLFFLCIMFIVSAVIFCILRKVQNNNEVDDFWGIIFGLSGIMAIGANILSPVISLRTFFGPAIFLCMNIGYVFWKLSKIVLHIKYGRAIQYTVAVILIILHVPFYRQAYEDIYETYQVYTYREEQIKIVKEQGEDEVVFPKVIAKTKYNALYMLEDIQEDKNHWVNMGMARYFGLKAITGISNYKIQDAFKILSIPEKENSAEMYYGMIVDFCNGKHVEEQGKLFIDEETSILSIEGWSADFLSFLPNRALYIAIGNDVYKCDYGLERVSVAEFYNCVELKDTGFVVSVPISKEDNKVEFIAIGSDGTYRFFNVVYEIIRQ